MSDECVLRAGLEVDEQYVPLRGLLVHDVVVDHQLAVGREVDLPLWVVSERTHRLDRAVLERDPGQLLAVCLRQKGEDPSAVR